jgi:hypothetical protein
MIMPEDFFAVDESLPIDWESGMELVSGEEKRRQDELTGYNFGTTNKNLNGWKLAKIRGYNPTKK